MTQVPAFENAIKELSHAAETLSVLKRSKNEREFLTNFNAFVGAAQSVLIALLKEGRGYRLPGFSEWYDQKRDEMDHDELMALIREARDYDFTDGPHKLRFTASGEANVDEHGRPIRDESWMALPEAPSVKVSVENAPERHLGRRLDRTDPASMCKAVLDYLEEMIDEAVRIIS